MAEIVNTEREPWGPQQAPLQYGFDEGRRLYDQGPPQYYPGSTVAPLGDVTQQGLDMYQDIAQGPNYVLNAAQQQVGNTLSGGYLPSGGYPQQPTGYPQAPGSFDPTGGTGGYMGRGGASGNVDFSSGNAVFSPGGHTSVPSSQQQQPGAPAGYGMGPGSGNPYLDDVSNAAARSTTRLFSEAVMPSTQAMFDSAGRFGSGLYDNAMDSNRDNLARSLAEANAGLYGKAYENERGRQMEAAGMAPRISQAQYQPAAQLLNVGQVYDDKSQQNIEDKFNRYNYNMLSPYDHLGRYMGNIRGNYGGEGQSRQSLTGVDAFGQNLGLGLQGYGLAQELFGLGKGP